MPETTDAQESPDKQAQMITLPAVPAVAVNASQAAILMPDGELKILPLDQAAKALHKKPIMVVHAPFTKSRLGLRDMIAFDLLELFAFVHPAKFCVPTPSGLAKTLGITVPEHFEDYPVAILESAQALLSDIISEQKTATARAIHLAATATPGPLMDGHNGTNQPPESNGESTGESKRIPTPIQIAQMMKSSPQKDTGWVWSPFIIQTLGGSIEVEPEKSVLHVWRTLGAWAEQAPPPPPSHHPVTGDEARERLKSLLLTQTHKTEARPEQIDFTTRITAAFAPAEQRDHPHVVLAEAGTGVGKTLGYIAPASLWAEKNDGTVWLSTYTKNLQRQIDQELDRLYPDPALKHSKVAIRKGRENYLCLLNFEDLANGAALSRNPQQIVAAGLMARWILATRDGDLSGADFPGWLSSLLGLANTTGLADRRGECVYAACDHYHKCFVERAIRKSRHASIVVANHALVMIQTALAGPEGDLPQRYVFDEGHHLFEAADSAFAAHLTAWETADLRRWILGPEQAGRRTRARGLKKRVEDLIAGQDDSMKALDAILLAAQSLPAYGWSHRLKDRNPHGVTEQFLASVYAQVLARAAGRDGPYSLEVDAKPVTPEVLEAARALKQKLRQLQKPIIALASLLAKRLEDHADTLDSDTRKRLDAAASSLLRRGNITLGGWIGMLESIEKNERDETYIDWMEIERAEGQASDVGLYRHWVDPMQAFAGSIRHQAHGIAITSATLRDGTGDADIDWQAAMNRTGAAALSPTVQRVAIPSPYDYAAQTRAFVITDVRKDDMAQVASAYRTLFTASGGGALGLFTAISRLRGVYDRIHGDLDQVGLDLYAQHVDDMDTGTLVDIFRAERHACLLGTDAVRDGVDVPGDALRLLVYDRVPWPRPTILHKARRDAFGGRHYDEMVTRMRLRQAFGRLIRRDDDKGVFVMLDSGLPSRLHGAFPEGVVVERIGLAEASAEIRHFLKNCQDKD